MPSSNTTPKKTRAAKAPQDRKEPTKRHGSSWKRPKVEVTMPSGDTAILRKVGVEKLLESGLLHSVDALGSVVASETLPKAEGTPKPKLDDVMKDPAKFDAMIAMMDGIAVLAVVEPKVLSPRTELRDEAGQIVRGDDNKPKFRTLDDDERDAIIAEYEEKGVDAVFADWIDLEDRMFIMDWIMEGSSRLSSFRTQPAPAVGGVSAGSASPLPAE